jgi:phosphatidylserine/phosphatidylglycerophosphate/cardiolipin synthase-like enzyme
MFIGELLQTGQDIWLVSPWISNVVLIDNRTGNFDTLNPEWGRKEIRLVEVLLTFMLRGCAVNVLTREDASSNIPFVNELTQTAHQNFVNALLNIKLSDKLHTKGLLLSKSLLIGSMNLTYNGLEMNDEWIQFSIDPEDISKTRSEFATYMAR